MDPHHHHHHPCHVIHPTTACCHSYLSPQYPNLNFQNYPFYHHQQQHSQYTNEPNDNNTLLSLLSRISALELALGRNLPDKYKGCGSLRDAAARVIQYHFRNLLVRRSRTLRKIKTLALVKSALFDLKISVSGNTRVDLKVVYRKAMELLLRIDSIQGGDSMIRDGKRSISRDLDRFLQLIDGFSVKRNKLSSIGLKNPRTRVLYNGQQIDTADFMISGRLERGSKERANRFYTDHHDEDAGSIELENFRVLNNGKIGSLPKRNGGLAKHGGNLVKAKKNVTFVENGDLFRGFVSTREQNSSEDGSVDEEGELLDNLRRRVQRIAEISKENGEDGQEAYIEDDESSQISNSEENSKRGSRENLRVLSNGKIGSSPKRNDRLPKGHHGALGKDKKNVTFAENGDLPRVFVSTHEPMSSEDGSVDEERELLDNLRRRVQKVAEISKENGDDHQECGSEDEESSQVSNVEENSKRVLSEGNYGGRDDDFVFSAPVPVKMESRADLMKASKA